MELYLRRMSEAMGLGKRNILGWDSAGDTVLGDCLDRCVDVGGPQKYLSIHASRRRTKRETRCEPYCRPTAGKCMLLTRLSSFTPGACYG